MATKKTEAQQRAQKKYMQKVGRLSVTMPLDRKQRIADHVRTTGESVNSFLNRAAEETLERDQISEDKHEKKRP